VVATASNEDLRALGVAVRTLRLARSLTQERLAEAAGLHTTYISGIESGQRNVGFINIARLARALGVDLPTLMREVERERRR
jgi:transcriptional regulator with XRE-family HTH domain